MRSDFLIKWRNQPIRPPTVDPRLQEMDGLARSTECIRYTLLSIEFWLCPEGHLREWFRRNLLLCAWLLIPAVVVMPVVGLILWQFSAWLSMLTGIAGKLGLILVTFVAIRIFTALVKR